MKLTQNVVDSLGEHVALLDNRGEIIVVNRAWRRYAERNGGSQDGYLHQNYLDICQQAVDTGDETAQLPLEGIRNVLQKKRPSFQYEYPCHSPTEQSWFLVAVTPLDVGAIVTHSEMTRRRRETSLAVSEHRLKEAFNALDAALYLVDSEATVLFYNREAEVMAGRLQATLRIGTPFVQLLPDAAKPLFDSSFMGALSGTPTRHELRVADLWLEVHYQPILEGDRVSEVCLNVRDITARKQREAALHEAKQNSPLYLARAPLAVVEWNLNHVITACNPEAERMFGVNARDVTGSPFTDVFGTPAQNLEPPPHDTFFLQTDTVKKRTQTVTYKWLCTPLRDAEGAVAGTVAFIQDVTEQLLLLAALKTSETQFLRIFGRNLTPMLVVTPAEFYVKRANTGFLSLSDYNLGEVVGHTLSELGLLPEVPKAKLQLLLGAAEGAPTEQHLRTRSGLRRTVLVQVEPLEAAHSASLLLSFLDVTKQWHTEAHLLRALQEVMQDSNWLGRAVLEKLAQYRSDKVAPPDTSALTRRERQVLRLLARGHTNEAIAETLSISHQTVRNYITHIYDKLELHSRAEAVIWARERGIGTG